MIAFTSNATNESYNDEYNAGYDPANGNPEIKIPADIITNQSDLSLVEVVSGATVTSRSILEAAQIARAYLEAQNG